MSATSRSPRFAPTNSSPSSNLPGRSTLTVPPSPIPSRSRSLRFPYSFGPLHHQSHLWTGLRHRPPVYGRAPEPLLQSDRPCSLGVRPPHPHRLPLAAQPLPTLRRTRRHHRLRRRRLHPSLLNGPLLRSYSVPGRPAELFCASSSQINLRVPAAIALSGPAFTCPCLCLAVPISLPAALSLFATGLRRGRQTSATIGGLPATVF